MQTIFVGEVSDSPLSVMGEIPDSTTDLVGHRYQLVSATSIGIDLVFLQIVIINPVDFLGFYISVMVIAVGILVPSVIGLTVAVPSTPVITAMMNTARLKATTLTTTP